MTPAKPLSTLTTKLSVSGKFDRSHMPFAHGQLYVALSRCRTLGGITLRQPLEKRHVIMDWRVVKFVTSLQYAKSEELCSIDERIKIIKKAIAAGFPLSITYLKNNDEKSRRTIEPLRIGEMEFKGKKYLGVEAFCRTRQRKDRYMPSGRKRGSRGRCRR